MGVVFNTISEWSKVHPHKTAIIQVGQGLLTYQELDNLTKNVALNLRKLLLEHPGYDLSNTGSIQNPPAMLIASDSLHSMATVLAINALGLTIAPINPDIGAESLSTARDAIGAGIVLHDNRFENKAHLLESDNCRPICIDNLVADAQGTLPTCVQDTESPYLLTLSSGSTGDPKPVIYTDAGKMNRASLTAAEFGFTLKDTILCASPFYHSLGQRLTYMPLLLGATMVKLPRFSANSWLDAAEKHKVTVTICVSSHLFALKDLLTSHDSRANSIRALVSSSASIDDATKAALFDSGQFDFYEMYGASEVATATRLGKNDPVEKRNSVGIPCAGIAVKIINADNVEMSANNTGEICIQSPLCTPGYYQRPDLDAAAFDKGWFHTGDLGFQDNEGYLYFVDRTSDVIISGGSNIYPSDVESCLRKHPDIGNCLVVGVKDGYLGEAVIAIIVGNPTATDNLERELRRHVRSTLASSQQPLLYFVVDELPLNSAGKVDRKRVRQEYNALDLNPSARFSEALMQKSGT